MYRILGDGGQVFGPANAELVGQWIKEGRLNASSQIQRDGETVWKSLGTVPEFATFFGGASISPQSHSKTKHSLDVFGCVGGGWKLFKSNPGLLTGSFGVYLLIWGGFFLLGMIPLIGWVFSLLFWVISGPLVAGLYQVALQLLRQLPTRIADMFAASNNCFGQLFLAQIVPSLLVGLCIFPGLILGMFAVLPALLQTQAPSMPMVLTAAVCVLLGIPAMIFFSVNWMFALPLVMDQSLGFWEAMGTSSRAVRRHWWSVFGLLIVLGLMNILGFLCCVVGVLISVPVTIGAIMVAYERLFGSESSLDGLA